MRIPCGVEYKIHQSVKDALTGQPRRLNVLAHQSKVFLVNFADHAVIYESVLHG